MATAPALKLVHLSDLHLTAAEGQSRSEPQLFGRLTGMNEAFRDIAASEAVQTCDHLLITGDVTDDGSRAAWQVFWETIRIYGLRDRCLVLPGNHDVCCLGARLFTGSKRRLTDDYQKMLTGLRLGGSGQPTKFPWAREIVPGQVVIIGLDSCNKGNRSAITNAMGHLGHRQLEALARLLKKHHDVPVKIVALHHSPNIPGQETARRRKLEEMSDAERWGMEVPEADRRTLRLLCLTSGVRLVVHGHVHMKENRYVNGVRFVGAPASTEPLGKGKSKALGFWIYRISANRKRVETLFQTV